MIFLSEFCLSLCFIAAVFLGIAEDELGHRLESLEQLFAQAQEVTLSFTYLLPV